VTVSSATAPDQVKLIDMRRQTRTGHLVGMIDTLEAGEGASLFATAGRYLGDARRLPTPPSGGVPTEASPRCSLDC
jgi:hypothetical protein